MLNKPKVPINSHKLRTFFSAIFGTVAVYLILSSVTVVWLNQTLTNTNTYVSTVAPLVTKPPIQNFIAQQVTTQILKLPPQATQGLASALLPASEVSGNQLPAQLDSFLKPVINTSVLKIIQSPSFATLWRSTNQSAHSALINQLSSNSSQITLDLSPAINGVVNELKMTQLSSVANKINIPSNAGNLDIKSNNISRFHQYYKWFEDATILIVIAAILSFGLSVWLSVHHAKTTRRILIFVGILSLFQALVLEAPSVVKLPGNNQITDDAAKAFVQALFHNLQLASLILGVFCLAVAITSKIFSHYRHPNIKQQKAPKSSLVNK